MNNRKYSEEWPVCSQHRENCFAYCKDGTCKVLNDTVFKNKKCPFYKNKEEQEGFENGI